MIDFFVRQRGKYPTDFVVMIEYMQPTDGQNTGRFHLMSQDLKRDFRLHRLLYTLSFMLIIIAVPWAIYNTLNEQWVPLVVKFVLISTGAVSIFLARKGKIITTFIVLSTMMFIITCMLSIIMYAPTLGTPRTVEIFFLLTGICRASPIISMTGA